MIAAMPVEKQKGAAERLLRIAYTAATKNPALLRCDPNSIVAAVVEASQMGLSVDGVLGHAYLVPYGNIAQMQLGYRGLIALAYRSGRIQRFACDTVYDGDVFDYGEGTAPYLVHKKPMKGPRGECIGAYAVAHLKDAALPMFRVMPIDEVLAHRDRSSGWQAFAAKKVRTTPWDTDPDAMAQKTAVRMLGKLLPVTEVQEAAARDEQRDQGVIGSPASLEELDTGFIAGEVDNGEA